MVGVTGRPRADQGITSFFGGGLGKGCLFEPVKAKGTQCNFPWADLLAL